MITSKTAFTLLLSSLFFSTAGYTTPPMTRVEDDPQSSPPSKQRQVPRPAGGDIQIPILKEFGTIGTAIVKAALALGDSEQTIDTQPGLWFSFEGHIDSYKPPRRSLTYPGVVVQPKVKGRKTREGNLTLYRVLSSHQLSAVGVTGRDMRFSDTRQDALGLSFEGNFTRLTFRVTIHPSTNCRKCNCVTLMLFS